MPRRREHARRREHLVRQTHDEFAAVAKPFAARLDRAAVQRHQALDQRQPDAEAAFGAVDRRVHLREHREQRRNGFLGQADAVVADGDHQLGVLDACAQLDAAVRVGVLRGVREQVADAPAKGAADPLRA